MSVGNETTLPLLQKFYSLEAIGNSNYTFLPLYSLIEWKSNSKRAME